jgi:hypothetical protein
MITGTKLGPDRRAITKPNERFLDIPRDRPAGEHAAELARELRAIVASSRRRITGPM